MSEDRFNLFFAILPDLKAALRIRDLAASQRRHHGLKGRLQKTDRFHVSLCGLEPDGRPLNGVTEKAKRAAQDVTAQPFAVKFNRVESFERKGAVKSPLVLVSDDDLVQLKELRRRLIVSLRKAGLRQRRLSGFTPHVTLLYDQVRLPEGYPIVPPIGWEVKSFALIKSHVGKTFYEPLGEWPLRGGDK